MRRPRPERAGRPGGAAIREPGDLPAGFGSKGRVDVVEMQVRSRREGGRAYPVLVWRAPAAMRMVATAPHGGGIGPRRWIVNAQVPASYGRRDPDHHLAKLAVSLGLPGRGVGMLTAADVRDVHNATDGGVEVAVTAGLVHPIWAAAPEETAAGSLIGTINVVAVVPEELSDAALVNAVGTATEAQAQALWEASVEATGTATDAVCIACPDEGPAAAFGGPRSVWGARLARAVHAALSTAARDLS